MLAASEVESILSGVGSFDDDLCALGGANGDWFFFGAALGDLEAAGVGVGSRLQNDLVAGAQSGASEDLEPFFGIS